ncbi:hypothetical protein MUK42_18196 [Musa troglodytarum]|uniref:Uncharacterized protein n=1 Tax=Musa troglodytarum TaxID=320322 RepID=A0A9E7L112_9LILI|nr:hypothetical protein MUK42_18196 [Musa troglodytarum]
MWQCQSQFISSENSQQVFISLAEKTGSMKVVNVNGGIFFGQLDELTCCLFLTKKLHFIGSKC